MKWRQFDSDDRIGPIVAKRNDTGPVTSKQKPGLSVSVAPMQLTTVVRKNLPWRTGQPTYSESASDWHANRDLANLKMMYWRGNGNLSEGECLKLLDTHKPTSHQLEVETFSSRLQTEVQKSFKRPRLVVA